MRRELEKGHRVRVLAALSLLTVLALVPRVVGSRCLLPELREPDAEIVAQARLLETSADPGRSKAYGKYPHLLAHVLRSLPAPADPDPRVTDLEAHLRAASRPYVSARWLVAILSALAVPATYLLSRIFLGPLASLFGAALVASSFLHFTYAQQARPHGALATFLLLATVAAVAMRRRPGAETYALAGAWAALAIGTLHTGLLVLPALAVAHLTRRDRRRAHSLWLLLPAALVAASLFLFYPFLWDQGATGSRTGLSGRSVRVGGLPPIRLSELSGAGFLRMPVLIWKFDPTLAVLGGVALVTLCLGWRSFLRTTARARLGDVAVVLALVVPYTALMGTYSRTAARYLVPLVPFLALAGTCGAVRALELPGLRRATVRGALAAVVLLLPSWAIGKSAIARARPDTTTRAAEWIAQNTHREHDRVLLELGLELPLFRRPDPQHAEVLRLWASPWTHYQNRLPEDLRDRQGHHLIPIAFPENPAAGRVTVVPSDSKGARQLLGDLDGDYAVVSTVDPDREEPSSAVVEVIRALGELVHRESPAAGASHEHHHGPGYQDRGSMFLRALGSERWGPTIEIYSLR